MLALGLHHRLSEVFAALSIDNGLQVLHTIEDLENALPAVLVAHVAVLDIDKVLLLGR